jgi:hypothetical protein
LTAFNDTPDSYAAFSSAEMPIRISQNGGVLWRWPRSRPISGRQNR